MWVDFCKDFALAVHRARPCNGWKCMHTMHTAYDVIYQRIKSILHSAFQQRMMSFGSTVCTPHTHTHMHASFEWTSCTSFQCSMENMLWKFMKWITICCFKALLQLLNSRMACNKLTLIQREREREIVKLEIITHYKVSTLELTDWLTELYLDLYLNSQMEWHRLNSCAQSYPLDEENEWMQFEFIIILEQYPITIAI